MGFSVKGLVLLSAAQDGTSLWSYRTDDPAATVLKPSYFHGPAASRVRPGDRIQVFAEANASPRAFDLVVLKVDGKKVETAVPGFREGAAAEAEECLERARTAAAAAEEIAETLAAQLAEFEKQAAAAEKKAGGDGKG